MVSTRRKTTKESEGFIIRAQIITSSFWIAVLQAFIPSIPRLHIYYLFYIELFSRSGSNISYLAANPLIPARHSVFSAYCSFSVDPKAEAGLLLKTTNHTHTSNSICAAYVLRLLRKACQHLNLIQSIAPLTYRRLFNTSISITCLLGGGAQAS